MQACKVLQGLRKLLGFKRLSTEFFTEFVNAAGSVNHSLFASVERMAR